jgi:hypothetical protein
MERSLIFLILFLLIDDLPSGVDRGCKRRFVRSHQQESDDRAGRR